MKNLRILAAASLLAAFSLQMSAQDDINYKRGVTYYENTLPPSPGPASAVRYSDIPFSHSSGIAEYDVPFYTIEGKELKIPIGLHYASGGIKLDEIAGVAGLGWTLEAGGCITRTVRDMPDEFSAINFRHQLPHGDMLDDLIGDRESCLGNTDAMNYLSDIRRNRVDSHLDMYNYNVCGLTGSFVILDDGTVFQFNGDGVRIEYDGPGPDDENTHGLISSFTLTGPDGTVYVLSAKETASHKGIIPIWTTPSTGQLDKWYAYTAWHVTEIRSSSGLEKATFTYSDSMVWERKTTVSRTIIDVYTTLSQITEANHRKKVDYIQDCYQTKVLTGISLNGINATFTYNTKTSSYGRKEDSMYQRNFPFRLTGITINSDGNDTELYRLDVNTTNADYDNRIVLNGLELYRGRELEDQWEFKYKTTDKMVSVGSQDWFGYYNGENETLLIMNPNLTDSYMGGIGDGSNNSPYSRTDDICPFEYNSVDGKLVRTNGKPDPYFADYMSLLEVNHDGMITSYVYEGNVIDSTSVGIRVKQIQESVGNEIIRFRNFTYGNPVAAGQTEVLEETYMTSLFTQIGDSAIPQYKFTYSIYDFPVTEGRSILDTRVFYGSVVEEVSAPDAATVRTVCVYDVENMGYNVWSTEERIPSLKVLEYAVNNVIPNIPIHPWKGIRKNNNDIGTLRLPYLVRKELYSSTDNCYDLVSSIDYTYNQSSGESILIGYNATQLAYYDNRPEYCPYDVMYHYPIYATCHTDRNPIKSVQVNYHTSGNDTTVVNTSYVDRIDKSMPIRVKSQTITEGKVIRQLSYDYPDTIPADETESWMVDLTDRHILSFSLKKTLTHIGIKPIGVDGPYIINKEAVDYDWIDIKGNQYLLPKSHKEYTLGTESWSETILTRDCKGNISSFKEKGRPETIVLWSYNGRYPVAVIENLSMSKMLMFINGQSFIDELTLSSAPKKAQLITLSGLRTIFPQAQITTYSYLPGVGITSMTDPAGITTTYEYDNAGRLTCVRDNDGNKIEEYTYSLMNDENCHKHMRSKVYRSADGNEFAEDVRWWDSYGMKLQDISIGGAGSGIDNVIAYESDMMLHDDVKVWLPYPVTSSNGEFQSDATDYAAAYYNSDKAFVHKNYEVSERDKVLSTALPGYEGLHETVYETDVEEDFPTLRWENGNVLQKGIYASDEIVVEKTTDADGRLKSVYKDHAGRVLGTANGDDEPTYYVYDLFDRLRAVAGSGIEFTDTLNMWRYDYDSQGRLASKGLPSSVREYYEYDDEDRVISVQRGGLLKEYEYDAFGRVLNVYHTNSNASRVLYENHQYDTYPDGMSGSNPKGLVTSSQLAEISPDGTVSGYVRIDYSYDDRHRVIKTVYHYPDGSELTEDVEYKFAGEAASKVYTYRHGTSEDVLTYTYGYDGRGRNIAETATLKVGADILQSGIQTYSYDDIGRLSKTASFRPGKQKLSTEHHYTLQGWQDSINVTFNNNSIFAQSLGYDVDDDITGYEPQYSGYVALKDETWFPYDMPSISKREVYGYDYVGRLSTVHNISGSTDYTYDARGNIRSIINEADTCIYEYLGDKVWILTTFRSGQNTIRPFLHDNLGRMVQNGQQGNIIQYNDLDLVRKIFHNGVTLLVKYSYLADGTKISALRGSGEGLVYRGPFVYRQSADSSLTLESASFSGGLLTPDNVLLYVRDYLGSVRAVVDAETGALYKAVDYSAFGKESGVTGMQLASLPSGMTLRDGYTGKEDQSLDFGAAYVDFGARQYSPALNRWLTIDPLSEQFYGTSPYAFCNNNPVNYVDVDGEFPDIIWDIASIGMGAKSLVDNVRAGNTRAAIGDGVGIVIDAFAAAVPFVPGGVGALRTGAKLVDVADDAIGAVRGVDNIKFKKFTAGNFRDNLARLTGEMPEGKQAHHILPQKFIDFFLEADINIHDPKYGAWLDTKLHQKYSNKYNVEWDNFFKHHANPSQDEIYDFADKLMKEIYE